MNHCHFEVAKGKYTHMYDKNSQGVYHLPNSISPDKACVVDGVTIYNGGQPTSSGNKMSWKKAADVPTKTTTTTTTSSTAIPAGFTKESATFTVTVGSINVRDKASTSGTVVAKYKKGQSVKYDCYKADQNGYVWISYISATGVRRYMACGVSQNYKNVQPYGTFK